jgi:putative transcriptional regulator
MTDKTSAAGYLTGQLLIAMPQMSDPRFVRTVIYICAHNADGAMGLVVNRTMPNLKFSELAEQLNLKVASGNKSIRVHFGGPVETGRGFVLHSADYKQDTTLLINDSVGLTATIDILKSIAEGKGPKNSLLALGYAGWGPGQLDGEIQNNGWLSVPSDEALIFGQDIDSRWEAAMAKLGISAAMLSGDAGHA